MVQKIENYLVSGFLKISSEIPERPKKIPLFLENPEVCHKLRMFMEISNQRKNKVEKIFKTEISKKTTFMLFRMYFQLISSKIPEKNFG